MSMPIIKPSSTKREQAITDLIQSVALEQASLSHILNAEGEKIQKALLLCNNTVISGNHYLQSRDFVYNGDIAYWGLPEQGYAFAVFKIKDEITGEEVYAYCMDVYTFIHPGEHYTVNILAQAPDLSENHAQRIRSILINAFPFITLTQLQALSGIATLTQAEAVTGAQLAIWKLSNDFTLIHSNANVMALYNWYMSLAPTPILIKPGQIVLTADDFSSETGCEVTFKFYSDEKNEDGTWVNLSFMFDKDIHAIYGANYTYETINGVTTMTVTDLPSGAEFSLFISGIQTLVTDAYRYEDSQDLTGLLKQLNYMNATATFKCGAGCVRNLMSINNSVIEMVNSITKLEMVLQGKLGLFKDCSC